MKNVPPEKMRYLEERRTLLQGTGDPAVYNTKLALTVDWLGECSGRTKLRDVDIVSDERAESTGYGRGVGPAQTFLAGLGFSHMTQWGRAAATLGLSIESLREDVRGIFDQRGEYLFEEGHPNLGFTEITFEVRMACSATADEIRAFASWADRSPPHATLRRATRLVGLFYLNDRHLITAVYHPDRTEWRGYA
jgi:uncharacterized OsmC-like protein